MKKFVMSTALIGTLSLGAFALNANGQDLSLQDQINKLEEIGEQKNVVVEVNQAPGVFSIQSELSQEQFEELQKEVEDQVELLNALVDKDNWEAKGTLDHSGEIGIMNVTENVLGTQSLDFDLSNLNEGNNNDWGDGTTVPIVTRNITARFDYEGNPSSGVLPTFVNVRDTNSSISGFEGLDWVERDASASISSIGTSLNMQADGEWKISAENYGLELGLSQEDEWVMEYSSRNIN